MPKPRKLWHNATIPARQSAHYASADVQGDDHPASPCNLAARNNCKAADCEVPFRGVCVVTKHPTAKASIFGSWLVENDPHVSSDEDSSCTRG
jgi:hypothetical protein